MHWGGQDVLVIRLTGCPAIFSEAQVNSQISLLFEAAV